MSQNMNRCQYNTGKEYTCYTRELNSTVLHLSIFPEHDDVLLSQRIKSLIRMRAIDLGYVYVRLEHVKR